MRVRYNHAGKLRTLVYEKVVVRNVEPVEKQARIMCIRAMFPTQEERIPFVIYVVQCLSSVPARTSAPTTLSTMYARNTAHPWRASA